MKLGTLYAIVGILLLSVVWAFGMSSETPLGGLSGSVVMSPSGKPLPNAEVIVYPQNEVPEGSKSNWVTETDAKGNFRLRGLPVGLYQVQVYGKSFQSKDNLAVIIKEGKSEHLNIDTVRPYDSIELSISQKVYLPTEEISFTLNGYSDETKSNLTIYRVPYSQVFERGDPETLVRSLVADRNSKVPTQLQGLERAYEEGRDLVQKDLEGHFVEQVKLKPQSEGLYLVQAIIGKETKFAWVTVSKIALVTKAQGNQTLAFVADLETGQPVPDASISFMAAGSLKSAGMTNEHGTLNFSRTAENKETKVVVAESGSSRAFTWFYTGRDGNSGKTVLWAQTDRPVYRPGDTVQYKVTARDSAGTSYLVTAGNVGVEILDADQEVIDKKELKLSPEGTASGTFKIDSQTLPESYTIKLTREQSTSFHDVAIVSYRKPEYKVTVTANKKQLIRGGMARFLVHVETYTGEPGANMDVAASVYQKQDWKYSPFDDEGDNEYEGSSDYLGEFINEKKGRTDRNGDCWIETTTNGGNSADDIYSNSIFTIDASVSDQSGRTVTSKASVSVIRGEFDLVATTEKYIYDPGQVVSINLEAKPELSGTSLQNQELKVVYGHYRWTKKNSIFVEEGSQTLRLDEAGQSKFEAIAKYRGEFIIRATSKDSKGNVIGVESSVWIDTSGTEYDGPIPEIGITLDKANYLPTDGAKVLIRTESPGGQALLTVEGDGVLWSQVVPLTSKITTCDLTGLQDYAPNVTVSVSYVRKRKYLAAQKNLKVDLTEKKFNVEIIPDKPIALPGDIVNFRIRASSNSGQPVSANFALSVVDDSVYAIAEDMNDPVKAFYPRRWSTVQTAFSFPDVYLDGEDKNPLASRTRKNFKDTAFWNPDVNTNELGEASVSLQLPDNLTDWRATVKGFTRDTRIAQGVAHVVAKKEVMARLTLPSYLVEGDTQTIFARITNTSSNPRTLTANISTIGAQIQGEPSQRITIEPEESKTISWKSVSSNFGTATFKLSAMDESGTVLDSLEQKVPIHVYGETEESSFVGQVSNTASGRLELAPTSVEGNLRIQVSPTLLGSLIDALPSLVGYPYGCTEQTMSRFVPAVLVVRKLRASGLVDADMEARLPGIVHDSLIRIKRLQSSQGGWGWWEFDSPDEWMTSYVLEGLWRAKNAGVNTATIDLERSLSWSMERMKTKPSTTAIDAPMRISDRLDLATSIVLYDRSPQVISMIESCLAYGKIRSSSLAKAAVSLSSAKVRRDLAVLAYRKLMTLADETADTLHWPDDGWYQETGAALEAVAVMEPKSPKLEKAFRYLNSQKRGSIWTSTRDTARIIVSAATYLENSKEVNPDCDVTVLLNGVSVGVKHFSRSDLTLKPYELNVPMSLLRKGANEIQFKVTGSGKAYFSAVLNQNVRKMTMPPKTTIKSASIARNFYEVVNSRGPDGVIKRTHAKSPTQVALSGQVLRARVEIVSGKQLDNVMIEVPMPSNMRIVDEEMPLDGVTWQNWWARTIFLDDRAVFFGTVPAGKPAILEFAVRAESPGESAVLPASLIKMYQPAEKITTFTQKMTVRPK